MNVTSIKYFFIWAFHTWNELRVILTMGQYSSAWFILFDVALGYYMVHIIVIKSSQGFAKKLKLIDIFTKLKMKLFGQVQDRTSMQLILVGKLWIKWINLTKLFRHWILYTFPSYTETKPSASVSVTVFMKVHEYLIRQALFTLWLDGKQLMF